MAYADYRLCDVCEKKAFYDANLNYMWVGDDLYPGETKQAGQGGSGMGLERCGDWAVLCRGCAETYKCAIVPQRPAVTDEQIKAICIAEYEWVHSYDENGEQIPSSKMDYIRSQLAALTEQEGEGTK